MKTVTFRSRLRRRISLKMMAMPLESKIHLFALFMTVKSFRRRRTRMLVRKRDSTTYSGSNKFISQFKITTLWFLRQWMRTQALQIYSQKLNPYRLAYLWQLQESRQRLLKLLTRRIKKLVTWSSHGNTFTLSLMCHQSNEMPTSFH